MGKLGEATIFASETVALDVIGATFIRDVEPGELVIVNDSGIRSLPPVRAGRAPPLHLRACLFLAARLDRRRHVGLRSPQERSAPSWRAKRRSRPTMSCRCPTAACPRRSASARQSGIPFELGIIRSHYVGRTFIQPSQEVRHLGVKLKHNANSRADRGQAHRADRRFDRSRHDQP